MGCSSSQEHLTAHFPEADSLIQQAIDKDNLPGAVLLVAQHDNILFHKAYGYAKKYDYGGAVMENPDPMTIDHRFDLASLTKVLATTYGIMMLIDDGQITLEDPVHLHLPAFSSPSKDSITVRHLLSHTAGLYPWKPLYYHAANPDETYAYIANLELATPVGAQRRYSDLGFMLLGYLIEEVSQQPLHVFMHERLYTPLGLTDTGFTPNEGPFAATSHGNPFEKRMVADDNFGYVCDEDPESFTSWRTYVLDGEVNDGNAYHAHKGVAGHAGLFSTAQEVGVLMNLLLSPSESHLVSPETISTFLTPSETGHGLGWAMAAPFLPVIDPPHGTFGHTGFTGTFSVGIPEHNLAIVLLTNRQQTDVGPDGRYMSLTALRQSVVAAVLDNLSRD